MEILFGDVAGKRLMVQSVNFWYRYFVIVLKITTFATEKN